MGSYTVERYVEDVEYKRQRGRHPDTGSGRGDAVDLCHYWR